MASKKSTAKKFEVMRGIQYLDVRYEKGSIVTESDLKAFPKAAIDAWIKGQTLVPAESTAQSASETIP